MALGSLLGIPSSKPLESSKRDERDCEIAKRINANNEQKSGDDPTSDSFRTQVH